MDIDPARVRKYQVSGPEFGNPRESIYVEWRGRRSGQGPIQWAVTNGAGDCLNKRGHWEHEPQPSSRTDAFLRRTRWESFHDALCVAAGEVGIE